MKTSKFAGLMRKSTPNKILEEYMMGKHRTLTDKQLEKVCAKSDHRGGIAFTYKKRSKHGKTKQSTNITQRN